jgi:hypothetical protein
MCLAAYSMATMTSRTPWIGFEVLLIRLGCFVAREKRGKNLDFSVLCAVFRSRVLFPGLLVAVFVILCMAHGLGLARCYR